MRGFTGENIVKGYSLLILTLGGKKKKKNQGKFKPIKIYDWLAKDRNSSDWEGVKRKIKLIQRKKKRKKKNTVYTHLWVSETDILALYEGVTPYTRYKLCVCKSHT